jgi:hypothetical protein
MYRPRVIGDAAVDVGCGPDVVDGAVVDGRVDAVAAGVALQAVATTSIVRRPSRFWSIDRVSNARCGGASDIAPSNCYAGNPHLVTARLFDRPRA